MRLPTSIAAAALIAGCAGHASRPGAPLRVLTLPTAVTDSAAPAATPAPATPFAPAGIRADTAPAAVASPGDPTASTALDPIGHREVSLAAVPAPATPAAPVSARDVARHALGVFGDSLTSPVPSLRAPSLDDPTWDMDVRSYETQDRVAYYVGMFSGRGKSQVRESLAKGSRYESLIRAKFRDGGLPEDLYYLALIESGFNPNAYSRAAAVGMWQFMTSTGRGLGLRIDWWVDERRDPVASTAAAVRFIRGLRDQFGSLYLAAAAYNGGPGRVARGLARYSDDLQNTQQAEDAFFVLAEKDYLRNETREYVPQLIAAALVAKEPVRYGMTYSPAEPFRYDSVRVPGRTPLAAIASASGTSTAVIRELNPHILRGMTPPGRMLVRIPAGSAPGFDAAFLALPSSSRTATRTVVSRKGETVDGIADAHGISAAALEGFNPHLRHLKPSGRLVPGQAVVVPSVAVALAATHVPDPEIERYGRGPRHMRTIVSEAPATAGHRLARATPAFPRRRAASHAPKRGGRRAATGGPRHRKHTGARSKAGAR